MHYVGVDQDGLVRHRYSRPLISGHERGSHSYVVAPKKPTTSPECCRRRRSAGIVPVMTVVALNAVAVLAAIAVTLSDAVMLAALKMLCDQEVVQPGEARR